MTDQPPAAVPPQVPEPQKVRVYDFSLPAEFSGMQLWAGKKIIQSSDIWNHIPQELRDRVDAASKSWGGKLVITQDDLDRLDDNTWIALANRADLRWHYEEA